MRRYSYTFYLTMLLPLIPFFLGSCYVLAASVWARTVKKSHVRCAPYNNAVGHGLNLFVCALAAWIVEVCVHVQRLFRGS